MSMSAATPVIASLKQITANAFKALIDGAIHASPVTHAAIHTQNGGGKAPLFPRKLNYSHPRRGCQIGNDLRRVIPI